MLKRMYKNKVMFLQKGSSKNTVNETEIMNKLKWREFQAFYLFYFIFLKLLRSV